MRTKKENINKNAERIALDLFSSASEFVPAYKDFLKRNRINPANVKNIQDFKLLPIVDKKNYISKYSLSELCWNGNLESTINFPMSSGSSGESYFWPSGNDQDAESKKMFTLILDEIISKQKKSLLFVSSFAFGTWKAGVEVYDAVKSIAKTDYRVSIVTPSIDKHEAVRQISHLAKQFDVVVLAGYPPFVKDIIQLGIDTGLSLELMDLYLVTAGEAFSEDWRDGVLKLIGRPGNTHRVINFYGMAETGIIGFETSETIAMRRSSLAEMRQLIGGVRSTSLYYYDPLIRYLEVVQECKLILTSNSGIPLIRYDTRDEGGLLRSSELLEEKNSGSNCVFLFGRKDVSGTLYGVNIYIENIKAVLENKRVSRSLSGLFVMETKNKRNLDQYLFVAIETSKNIEPNASLQKELTRLLYQTLCDLNAEYNKLAQSIGIKARPKVKLVKHGVLQSTPGRKHKWVKKS